MTTEHAGPDEDARREIRALFDDTTRVLAVQAGLARKNPPDARTPELRTYRVVTGDLWRKALEHYRATALLLDQEMFDSGAVISRAGYEIVINLLYVLTQGDKIENAQRVWIRSLLEVDREMKNLPSGEDARRRLASFDPTLVEGVRAARRTRGQLWSGKTLREMAEVIGIVGHEGAYGVMSWATHGRVGGFDVIIESTGEGDLEKVSFASRAHPQHYEALANQARRMLRQTYHIFARDWFGEVPPLGGSDPEEVLRDIDRRYPAPTSQPGDPSP